MLHAGDQTPCQRPGCGHTWGAHAYDDPTSICREIVLSGDDQRHDPYLSTGHRWCGCQQFIDAEQVGEAVAQPRQSTERFCESCKVTHSDPSRCPWVG